MNVDPGQFQVLCNRATDLENAVAEFGREAMASAAVIRFADGCSYAVGVEDGLRRRRPCSAPARPEAPQGSRERAVSPAPVNRPSAGQVIALAEFAVCTQYRPFSTREGSGEHAALPARP